MLDPYMAIDDSAGGPTTPSGPSGPSAPTPRYIGAVQSRPRVNRGGRGRNLLPQAPCCPAAALPDAVSVVGDGTGLCPSPARTPHSFLQAASSPAEPFTPPLAPRKTLPPPSVSFSVRRCFRCLALDHSVDACRDPVCCRACGGAGHRSGRCPQQRLRRSASMPGLPLERTPGERAWAPARAPTPFPRSIPVVEVSSSSGPSPGTGSS